jgi:hypothetical protein
VLQRRRMRDIHRRRRLRISIKPFRYVKKSENLQIRTIDHEKRMLTIFGRRFLIDAWF